jgi:YVTN family beta-propeller protein
MSISFLSEQNILGGNNSSSGYHLIKKIEIGGDGGWDYLFADSLSRLLYVSRATHVIIINMDTYEITGDIPNTKGVHGIALAREFGKGFISNGRDSSVTIFDLNTFKEIDKVKVEKNPDAIIYDPSVKRVFAFNRGSSSVSVIDAANGKLAGRIDLGGSPEFATADYNGMVYVNLDKRSEVAAIDSRELTIKARWSLSPGESPSGMAIDRQNRILFSGCENKKMIIMDADSGKIVAYFPIGDGVDACTFDPETKLAFSSNGEGNLTVIQEYSKDSFNVADNVITQKGARTMALDLKTHNIFLATAMFEPPPEPTPENPHPRPTIIPGSFVILVFGR